MNLKLTEIGKLNSMSLNKLKRMLVEYFIFSHSGYFTLKFIHEVDLKCLFIQNVI